jgi:hypothetical protein
MAKSGDRNSRDATTFGEALDEAFEVVLEMQDLMEIPCPQPDCTEKAAVPTPSSDEDTVVARTASVSEADHEGRCSAGHELFVHY